MKQPLALISNLLNPVRPDFAGGLETFNYDLTQELLKRSNWDVKLYATGDSVSSSPLIPVVENSLLYSQTPEFRAEGWNYRRLTVEEMGRYTNLMANLAIDKPLIHFSLVNFLPIYLAIKYNLKSITTLHMPADNLHYQWLFRLLQPDELNKVNFVAISQTQAAKLPVVKTVIPNGINPNNFSFDPIGRADFIWIGRMIKEKGAAIAVELAKQLELPLTLAGSPTNQAETDYFNQSIKEYINDKIRSIGKVEKEQKTNFYHGRALLVPIQWEEPFGLVMIEALASGTPVIAFDRGAVREIIDDRVTGIICPADDRVAFRQAIMTIATMPEGQYRQLRQRCRQTFEARFTLERMVNRYEDLYEEINNQ